MKKNYVKSSVKVREIDMESLLSTSINGKSPTNLLDNSPTFGGNSNGTQPVGARKNLWSEEEEQ